MATALTCPVCNAPQEKAGGECTVCGSDLALLATFDSQALAYYNEALALARDEGKIDEAVDKLRVAATLDPRHAQTFLVLGKLHGQREEYAEAIAAFRRALEAAREGSEVHEKARRGLEKAEELLRRRQQQERAARRRRKVFGLVAVLGGLLIGVVAGRVGAPQPRPVAPAAPPASQVASSLEGTLKALPAALGPHLASGKGSDLVAALATSQVQVVAAADGSLQLQGSVPVPEARQFLGAIASAAAGKAVGSGALVVKDDYIAYVIQPGDCPERIARKLCGTRRRLEEIRNFSPENQQALERMRIGAVVKIPKRLLVNPSGGVAP
jgi:tetratricopeptide (TPR) repeat protein